MAPSRKTWLLPSACLLVAGIFALPLDLAIARWCLARNCPDAIHEILVNAEPFAHGIGVAVILLAAWILDPKRRWAMPRVALAVVAAGMFANLGKLMVARTRPNFFDYEGTVLSTFENWLPLTSAGSAAQSTPSAHAATAVALAIALAWIYPRGRLLFAALAVFATMHRVEIGVHFVSDALWGAAVGWFFGAGVIWRFLTPAFFNRGERRRAALRGTLLDQMPQPESSAASDFGNPKDQPRRAA